jgi:hypothetical protein
MESSGVPGSVNLSEQAYKMTRGLLDCEDRGNVHTKDGRDIPMFLVRGPAPDFAARYEAEFGKKRPGLTDPPELASSATAVSG